MPMTFDLQAARNGAPIFTASGQEMRLIAYVEGAVQPVVVFDPVDNTVETYHDDGRYFNRESFALSESSLDIFTKKE